MSFILIKNKINEVVVTPKERSVLVNPVYLFEFKNKKAAHYCICYDASPNTDRFQLFYIEDINGPDPQNSQVELEVGEYDYRIYEQLTSNINPSGLFCLEVGTVNVVSDIDVPKQEYASQTVTITYGG
jgi:hypothetical protein